MAGSDSKYVNLLLIVTLISDLISMAPVCIVLPAIDLEFKSATELRFTMAHGTFMKKYNG